MKPLRILIAGTIVGVVAVALGVSAAGAHGRSCGTPASQFGRENIVVIHGDVNCAAARRVTKAFNRQPGSVRTDGYECNMGHLPQKFLEICGKLPEGWPKGPTFEIFKA